MSIDKSKIKNIIFDFGGVLFEIDYHLPAKEFAKLGFDDFAKIYSQAAQNEIFDRLETGRISNEEFMHYLHQFVPNATREQVNYAWNCILLHIMPEQVEAVYNVKNKGYRTFLLSNTNAIHVAEFERMTDEVIGIDYFKNAFEKVYYSNEIHYKKPYPETFLKVCEWNGLNPKETLFIDDSAQHVRGAAESGLHAYHLQAPQRLSDFLKDW
ncbi:MAG TPA: HAD family phosphatase [Flavobacteriales bacterium]